jgi:hypothetical protein
MAAVLAFAGLAGALLYGWRRMRRAEEAPAVERRL